MNYAYIQTDTYTNIYLCIHIYVYFLLIHEVFITFLDNVFLASLTTLIGPRPKWGQGEA